MSTGRNGNDPNGIALHVLNFVSIIYTNCTLLIWQVGGLIHNCLLFRVIDAEYACMISSFDMSF